MTFVNQFCCFRVSVGKLHGGQMFLLSVAWEFAAPIAYIYIIYVIIKNIGSATTAKLH